MSIMAMEAARIRSSSADIAHLGSSEDKLSKVPRVEAIRKASAEESLSDAQKTSAEKSKEQKKKTVKVVKAKKTKKGEVEEEEEDYEA